MEGKGMKCDTSTRSAQDAAQDALFVQTLNHFRHDWLNDIQVLYGYLKLKKYDKMEHYIDTIRQKMVRESGIANIGASRLACYLHQFRVRCRALELDVDIAPRFQLPVTEQGKDCVTDAVIAVADLFVQQAEQIKDGSISQMGIRFEHTDETVTVTVSYEGVYEQTAVQQQLALCQLGDRTHRIACTAIYNEEGAVVTIAVSWDRTDEVRHVSG